MGKKRIPELSISQKEELEQTYRTSAYHSLRLRCHLVLLKNQGHSSKYISSLKGYPQHQGTINNWISRYEKLGIEGLKNKAGQGRKKILNKAEHETKVKEIVKSERQRLTHAKSLIEKELDVQMSTKTLSRFLKALAEPTNE
jgi:transposase